MNILDKIIDQKRREVAEIKKNGLVPPGREIAPIRAFRQALVENQGVSIIAEVKKASPSKGLICRDFDPVQIAMDYELGGARAVSVLTDRQFFQGSLEYLAMIRENTALPLLRKDFIIDHLQVEEASLYGADAVLLIAAVLEKSLLSELIHHCSERGINALVEVHEEAEAEKALHAGAELVGINNRNLKDFSVSLDTTFRINSILPEDMPVVSESGISTPDDIAKLKEAGISAALIGEALVKDANRRVSALAAMVEAGAG
ncbi:MAG TPA: indole-3-glycerol phosphate synthase TrpC [Thermodesulfobacteriaceae bacterium]|nr:indole-3-glycerol phosphate synthase TrpC [Thermodesulfobacteriaceae bacterium]